MNNLDGCRTSSDSPKVQICKPLLAKSCENMFPVVGRPNTQTPPGDAWRMYVWPNDPPPKKNEKKHIHQSQVWFSLIVRSNLGSMSDRPHTSATQQTLLDKVPCAQVPLLSKNTKKASVARATQLYDKMAVCAERLRSRLDFDDIVRLSSHLETWAKRAGAAELTLGTGCSGSDIVVCVLRKLVSFWDDHFRVSLRVRHVMSVEQAPKVQEFLLEHSRPEVLFKDVCDLGNDCAHDILSGVDKPIPDCHVWVYGSECDNLSTLNSSTRQQGSISSGAPNKSGQTAAGCMRYVEKHKPAVVVIENVANMDAGSQWRESDKGYLERLLKSHGYSVFTRLMDARQSGCPQSRNRWYIMAFLKPGESQEAAGVTSIHATLNSVQVDTTWPIESFLLPDDHPEVQRVLGAWRNTSTKDIAKGNGPKLKGGSFAYEADHMESFGQYGLMWPPALEAFSAAQCGPNMGMLSRRQQEVVYFLNATRGMEYTAEEVRDLTKSLSWQTSSTASGCMGCLVSSARPWLMRSSRPMVAVEALMVQGFDLGDLLDHQTGVCRSQLSEATLIGIAGNMMNGFVLAHLWTCIFACVDTAACVRRHADLAALRQRPVDLNLVERPMRTNQVDDDGSKSSIVSEEDDPANECPGAMSGESAMESDTGL